MDQESIKHICKTVIGGITIIGLVGLQIYAWETGHNGTVFAFTSGMIGLIGGSFFDLKGKIKEMITQ